MGQRITDTGELSRLLGLGCEREVRRAGRVWNLHRHSPIDARGTVLFVAGLGMHRTEWSAELVDNVQRAGFATVMVDNHDAGLTRVRSADATYGLGDLAHDLVGLLDALEVERVHAVGISMGGMIAQHLARLAPERISTLTSLASTTSRRGVGRPAEQAKWIFTTPLPADRSAYLGYVRAHHESITSESHRDVERAVWIAEKVWKRGVGAEGYLRQLAAIRDDGDRFERLNEIRVPTLVLHGDADPMIDISGGRDTAAAIPGSSFVVIPGMGHVVTWQSAERVARHLVSHFG